MVDSENHYGDVCNEYSLKPICDMCGCKIDSDSLNARNSLTNRMKNVVEALKSGEEEEVIEKVEAKKRFEFGNVLGDNVNQRWER